ncbi:hypothetical protein QTP88_024890 [Uroleucon formosanum]
MNPEYQMVMDQSTTLCYQTGLTWSPGRGGHNDNYVITRAKNSCSQPIGGHHYESFNGVHPSIVIIEEAAIAVSDDDLYDQKQKFWFLDCPSLVITVEVSTAASGDNRCGQRRKFWFLVGPSVVIIVEASIVVDC